MRFGCPRTRAGSALLVAACSPASWAGPRDWQLERSCVIHQGMPERIADLSVRPRKVSDDDFLDALGARAFARFMSKPETSIRQMASERGSATAIALAGGTRVGFVIVGFSRFNRPFGPW